MAPSVPAAWRSRVGAGGRHRAEELTEPMKAMGERLERRWPSPAAGRRRPSRQGRNYLEAGRPLKAPLLTSSSHVSPLRLFREGRSYSSRERCPLLARERYLFVVRTDGVVRGDWSGSLLDRARCLAAWPPRLANRGPPKIATALRQHDAHSQGESRDAGYWATGRIHGSQGDTVEEHTVSRAGQGAGQDALVGDLKVRNVIPSRRTAFRQVSSHLLRRAQGGSARPGSRQLAGDARR